jgi:hypothetical protein
MRSGAHRIQLTPFCTAMLGKHLVEGCNNVFVRLPHAGAYSHPVQFVTPMTGKPLPATAFDFGVDEAICSVVDE